MRRCAGDGISHIISVLELERGPSGDALALRSQRRAGGVLARERQPLDVALIARAGDDAVDVDAGQVDLVRRPAEGARITDV